MKGIRIVVTGGRDYNNTRLIYAALNFIHEEIGIKELATGECPYGGADLHAKNWAIEHGIAYKSYPADFEGLGKKAGPMRNQYMLEDFNPDAVVAFNGGRGTADCKKKAEALNIFVWDFAIDDN